MTQVTGWGKALSHFQTPEKRGAKTPEEDVFGVIKGPFDRLRRGSGWRTVNFWRQLTSINTGKHPERVNFLTIQTPRGRRQLTEESGWNGPSDWVPKSVLCIFPARKALSGLVCIKEISKTDSRTDFGILISRLGVFLLSNPIRDRKLAATKELPKSSPYIEEDPSRLKCLGNQGQTAGLALGNSSGSRGLY